VRQFLLACAAIHFQQKLIVRVLHGAKRYLAGYHYGLRKRWNTASYIVPFCWSAEIGVRKISISPSFSCSMRWVRWSSRGLNGPRNESEKSSILGDCLLSTTSASSSMTVGALS